MLRWTEIFFSLYWTAEHCNKALCYIWNCTLHSIKKYYKKLSKWYLVGQRGRRSWTLPAPVPPSSVLDITPVPHPPQSSPSGKQEEGVFGKYDSIHNFLCIQPLSSDFWTTINQTPPPTDSSLQEYKGRVGCRMTGWGCWVNIVDRTVFSFSSLSFCCFCPEIHLFCQNDLQFSAGRRCWQSTIVVITSRVLPLAPPATWVLVTTLFLSFALVSSLAFALSPS